MKIQFPNCLLAFITFCTFSANAQGVINSGIWQTSGEPISIILNPEIKGRLYNYTWKELELSPGVWDWRTFDADLTSRTKDGLPVIFMIFTKEDAPDWLFTNGVPKVTEKDSRGTVTGYAPYYADADYKSYFKKMITAVRQHIEKLPSAVRNNIAGVQGCFGSTGDYISYKGEVSSQYALTGKDFSALFREFSGYYYDEYKNTSPAITLLSNSSNNAEDDIRWVVANCPGWLKCGTLGKGFQLNDEKDKHSWLYDILNLPQGGNYVRARSELLNSNVSPGWWKKMPYKNMFTTMCYAIHWGVDWSNQGGTQLGNLLYDSAFNFFNKYTGQKDPAKSTNAMCFLKDVLDASDAVRFPSATYGSVSKTNTQRYQNIVNKFTAYGALLEDVKSATLGELDNTQANGTNDVGWNLLPDNYDRYLHQLTPNATSTGYWNVQSADPNSMYGKFARSFDIANNKKALYFDVDNAFLLNTPLNGQYSITISVTYLDGPGGSWQLFYDSKTVADKASISITCNNTNTWKKAVVTLTDAYFGNRGPSTSDFSIRSTNTKNVMFSVVELSRPSNFTSAAPGIAAVSASGITDDAVSNSSISQNIKGIFINPNPVIDKFFITLKDGSSITSVEMYNQLGQVVLRKTVSGTQVTVQRNEIGKPAGIFYLKVFSGKKTYTGKVTVL